MENSYQIVDLRRKEMFYLLIALFFPLFIKLFLASNIWLRTTQRRWVTSVATSWTNLSDGTVM